MTSAPIIHKSGRMSVVVFNIGGNKYRLIAAIHYNTDKPQPDRSSHRNATGSGISHVAY